MFKTNPVITLERLPHRCTQRCVCTGQKPYLVRVSLNKEAKDELAMRTGRAADDQIVCTSTQCGGLMQALLALAPLQELVK